MATKTNQYLIPSVTPAEGVFVEATKSEGGGFYDITVKKTGDKQRYLSDVFESVAIPLGQCKTHKTPHPKNRLCENWSHV